MDADVVFALHDAYDYAHASNGESRYGTYLAQHGRRFHYGDRKPTTEPAEFAATAFAIASAPIMSPPYVGTHPRVLFASPRWDPERRCALLIDLAVPLTTTIADQLPAHFGGWMRDQYTSRYHAPDTNDQPAACTRLAISIPLPVDLLPPPAYTASGVADVHTAKHAVRALCTYTNSILTHLITRLDNHADDNPAGQWLAEGSR